MASRKRGSTQQRQEIQSRAQMPEPSRFPRDAVRASSYQIDLTWDYSNSDKDRIANFLNYNAKVTDQVAWAMSEITSAARHYRGEVAYEEKDVRRRPSLVQKQIRDLAKSLDQLHRRVAALSEEARAALDSFALALNGQPVTPALNRALKTLDGARLTIGEAADASAKIGAPTKEARRNFIRRLAAIWTAVHGEWPKRTGWEDERENFPFNEFVWECVEPLAGYKGLDGAIREVCEMDPHSAKAILATYVSSKAPKKK